MSSKSGHRDKASPYGTNGAAPRYVTSPSKKYKSEADGYDPEEPEEIYENEEATAKYLEDVKQMEYTNGIYKGKTIKTAVVGDEEDPPLPSKFDRGLPPDDDCCCSVRRLLLFAFLLILLLMVAVFILGAMVAQLRAEERFDYSKAGVNNATAVMMQTELQKKLATVIKQLEEAREENRKTQKTADKHYEDVLKRLTTLHDTAAIIGGNDKNETHRFLDYVRRIILPRLGIPILNPKIGGCNPCRGGYPGWVQVDSIFTDTPGEKAAICDEGFDINDVKVLCRQINNNNRMMMWWPRHGHYFGKGNLKLFMKNLRCKGDEKYLIQCPFDGFTRSCNGTGFAGINCSD